MTQRLWTKTGKKLWNMERGVPPYPLQTWPLKMFIIRFWPMRAKKGSECLNGPKGAKKDQWGLTLFSRTKKRLLFCQKSPPANHETLNLRRRRSYRFTSGTKSVKKYLTVSHIDLDIFLCIIDQLHSQSPSSRLSRGLDCHEANL